jgi:hypothetical protein
VSPHWDLAFRRRPDSGEISLSHRRLRVKSRDQKLYGCLKVDHSASSNAHTHRLGGGLRSRKCLSPRDGAQPKASRFLSRDNATALPETRVGCAPAAADRLGVAGLGQADDVPMWASAPRPSGNKNPTARDPDWTACAEKWSNSCKSRFGGHSLDTVWYNERSIVWLHRSLTVSASTLWLRKSAGSSPDPCPGALSALPFLRGERRVAQKNASPLWRTRNHSAKGTHAHEQRRIRWPTC